MGWNFDPDVVIDSLINILDQQVGYRLSFLPLPDGNPSTMRSIIPDLQGGDEPPLPFIVLSYEGSDDSNGFLFDSGTIEVEDPLNPPNMICAPYWDTSINFGITLTCSGLNAQSILQEVRKKFLPYNYRQELNETGFSSIELITPIRRVPDLLDTEYREVATCLLKFNTIDRLIDTNAGTFDTINYESTYRIDEDDPNPIITEGSVTSQTP
jgi:hypothetical protein